MIQIRLNSNHDFCAEVWRATASFEVTREECKEEKDKESLLERAQIGKMSVNPRLEFRSKVKRKNSAVKDFKSLTVQGKKCGRTVPYKKEDR